jgi:hypothetical protein
MPGHKVNAHSDLSVLFFHEKFYPCLIFLTERSQPHKLPVVNERTTTTTTLDIRLAFISSSFFSVFIPFLLLLLLLV